MNGFVIHALRISNGILALSPLPGRGGRYADDLAHIADWRPSIVISLTTMGEMFELGAERLGNDVKERGTRWIHLPLADMSTPNGLPADWDEAMGFALSSLNGGGRVLVHCLAGCGRSGMFVLKLMIKGGEVPETALKRLRKVRPCAVETEAQFHWALA